MHSRVLFIATAAILAALGATACGGADETPATPAKEASPAAAATTPRPASPAPSVPTALSATPTPVPGAATSPATTAAAATGPVVTVTNGAKSATVTVEFAATMAEREIGLMNRKSMADDAGMLFLFPNDQMAAFWMKDTYIPLDIAYIDSKGKVLEIHAAKALDLTPIYPRTPYRYTLEVNLGWFSRNGLGVGSIVTFPANMPAAK